MYCADPRWKAASRFAWRILQLQRVACCPKKTPATAHTISGMRRLLSLCFDNPTLAESGLFSKQAIYNSTNQIERRGDQELRVLITLIATAMKHREVWTSNSPQRSEIATDIDMAKTVMRIHCEIDILLKSLIVTTLIKNCPSHLWDYQQSWIIAISLRDWYGHSDDANLRTTSIWWPNVMIIAIFDPSGHRHLVRSAQELLPCID